MTRHWAAVLVVFALACGYSVHDDQSTESEGGTTKGGSATTTTPVTATTTVGSTTTTTTTTGSSGSSSSTGCPELIPSWKDTDCGFVCPDSDGSEPPWCYTYAQDCPACQKCSLFDHDGDGYYDASACFPETGRGVHGDPCTTVWGSGVDDCAAGYMCWSLDDDGNGTCHGLCKGTPENPDCRHAGTDTTCVFAGGSPLHLCLDVCDPLDPATCGRKQVCIGDPQGDGFVCVVDDSGGDSPAGTHCEYANTCNKGLFCMRSAFAAFEGCWDSLGCCTPFCDLTAGDGPCQEVHPDFTCVPWYGEGMAPEGLDDVGICGVSS